MCDGVDLFAERNDTVIRAFLDDTRVHGVVTNVKDGPTLTLKVDDNCKLTVDKSAVVTVLTKETNAAA